MFDNKELTKRVFENIEKQQNEKLMHYTNIIELITRPELTYSETDGEDKDVFELSFKTIYDNKNNIPISITFYTFYYNSNCILETDLQDSINRKNDNIKLAIEELYTVGGNDLIDSFIEYLVEKALPQFLQKSTILPFVIFSYECEKEDISNVTKK